MLFAAIPGDKTGRTDFSLNGDLIGWPDNPAAPLSAVLSP